MTLDNLDKYSYESTIGKLSKTEVPDLNGMTTASVDSLYPWLGMSWETSSNTSLKNGTPFNREYTELEEANTPYDIEEIDLGYIDPDLEGRHFYRLTNYFYENTYSSSGDFYRWEYEKYKYMQELLYHNKVSSTQTWKRPFTGEDPNIIYSDFTKEPLVITIDAGKALGIRLTSDAPFLVDGILHTDDIKLSPLLDPQVVITFPNLTNLLSTIDPLLGTATTNEGIPRVAIPTPTYLKMELYGEVLAQRMFHVAGEIEEEQEMLMHPLSTPFSKRLVPPGKPNVNKQFWNYRDYQPPIIEDFTNRRTREASWSITLED